MYIYMDGTIFPFAKCFNSPIDIIQITVRAVYTMYIQSVIMYTLRQNWITIIRAESTRSFCRVVASAEYHIYK